MNDSLDATHDASLRSWVSAANQDDSDFPIQNLPFGIFRPRGGGGRRGTSDEGRVGVAIGDRILDLAACAGLGLLKGDAAAHAELFADHTLNRLMARGRGVVRSLRPELVDILRDGNAAAQRRADEITVAMSDADMLLPARIGNYTDFYASLHHATNVGTMLRPDNPLLPNYKYIPIGYHGRASSVVASGAHIRRPAGQTRDDAKAPPVFGTSKRMDYEMEVGAFVGPGNALGEPVPLALADDHLWGVCLLNDWSARDLQSWESQPLGPFLSKNFATTISPWVVTCDALAPFRVPASPRAPDDPPPLPYLSHPSDRDHGALDLSLDVWLRSAQMRQQGASPTRVSSGRFRTMYWTLGQLLAHHTSNGCNLQPGDLIGSGTVSGPTRDERGCLLERTWRGTEPLELPTGERRTFLEDGDEVVMRGSAARDGYRRIGFGECGGVIAPAR